MHTCIYVCVCAYIFSVNIHTYICEHPLTSFNPCCFASNTYSAGMNSSYVLGSVIVSSLIEGFDSISIPKTKFPVSILFPLKVRYCVYVLYIYCTYNMCLLFQHPKVCVYMASSSFNIVCTYIDIILIHTSLYTHILNCSVCIYLPLHISIRVYTHAVYIRIYIYIYMYIPFHLRSFHGIHQMYPLVLLFIVVHSGITQQGLPRGRGHLRAWSLILSTLRMLCVLVLI